MPKQAKTLTPFQIKKLKDGRFAVGVVPNLYVIKINGQISCWMLRDQKYSTKTIYYKKHLSLEEVRDLAMQHYKEKLKGNNPKELLKVELENKRKQEEERKFKELEATYTLEYITVKWFDEQEREGRWIKTTNGRKKEFNRIKKDIFPSIGNQQISSITAQKMAEVLKPLYLHKKPTAERVVGYLKRIFAWADSKKIYGKIESPFNTDFMVLTETARSTKKNPKHDPALPFNEIPTFIKALLEKGDIVSLAIVFSILTASRGKALRLATWNEFDLKEGIWLIPQDHDKMKRSDEESRKIFLSPQAINFLNLIPRTNNDKDCLVFPPNFDKPFKPMTDNTIGKHIRDMHSQKLLLDGIGWIDPREKDPSTGKPKSITQHGTARSSFRTWSEDDVRGNNRKYDKKAVELCLLHKIDDPYNGAYSRHLLEKDRREIMRDWSKHCLEGINLRDYLPKSK